VKRDLRRPSDFMKTLALAFLAAALIPLRSYALDCPRMPEQARKDSQVEVKAAVAKIGPVTGAELETVTKAVTQDLMSKLPQADKVYLEQMMYATYCSALCSNLAKMSPQNCLAILSPCWVGSSPQRRGSDERVGVKGESERFAADAYSTVDLRGSGECRERRKAFGDLASSDEAATEKDQGARH